MPDRPLPPLTSIQNFDQPPPPRRSWLDPLINARVAPAAIMGDNSLSLLGLIVVLLMAFKLIIELAKMVSEAIL